MANVLFSMKYENFNMLRNTLIKLVRKFDLLCDTIIPDVNGDSSKPSSTSELKLDIQRLWMASKNREENEEK